MHAAYCSANDGNYCILLKMGKENNTDPVYIFYLSCCLHDGVIKYKGDFKKFTDQFTHMLVLAVEVSHSPANPTMSNPVESWLKNLGWPAIDKNIMLMLSENN